MDVSRQCFSAWCCWGNIKSRRDLEEPLASSLAAASSSSEAGGRAEEEEEEEEEEAKWRSAQCEC